jgi:hypothetical protein
VAKADKKADKGKAAKGGKGGKGNGKGKGGEPQFGERVSVASHPKAIEHVRRAKGLGGIGGFIIAAYLSYHANIPIDQIGLRALLSGIAGYMLGWACSVTVWRHLVLAEMKTLLENGRMVLGTNPEAPADQGAAPETVGAKGGK